MGKRSIFFRNLEKKKLIFPLLLCLVIIFILNTIGKDKVNDIRNILIESSLKSTLTFRDIGSKFVDLKYFLKHDFNKSILKLHEENQKLMYEIENLKHLESENAELRELLELKNQLSKQLSQLSKQFPKKTQTLTLVIARITNVFSNDYVRSCVLDVGASDGIEVDDVVRNKDGFIGRISEVHDNWCNVLMITDTNSKLSVKIGDKQINAIVSGDNSENLNISMKNEDTMVEVGDVAETAYLENSTCDKIPVGTVFEERGTFFIKPFVNFNALHYVCVLKNK